MRTIAAVAAVSALTGVTAFGHTDVNAESANFVTNPSAEIASASNAAAPAGWANGSYGTNTSTLSWETGSARTGTRHLRAAVTTYTSGDAKWLHTPVTVAGAKTYTLMSGYRSTAATALLVEVARSTTTAKTYTWLASLAASPVWATKTVSFTAPADAVALRVLHVIAAVGTLDIDDISITDPAVADSVTNLLANPGTETASPTSPTSPAAWSNASWGASTRKLTWETSGARSGSRFLRSNVTWFSTGDVKWAPASVAVTGSRTYRYTHWYRSSAPTSTVLEVKRANTTSLTYIRLEGVPAAAAWTQRTVSFTTPSDAVAVRIMHPLARVGTLDIDDMVLAMPAPTTTTSVAVTTTAAPTTTLAPTTTTPPAPSTTLAPTTTTTMPMTMGPYIDYSKLPAPAPGLSSAVVTATNYPLGPVDDVGSFRTVCRQSHMASDDPIVKPGQPGAAHLHTFFGNTGLNAFTTQSSLTTTGNSTCSGGTLNRSAYWMPSLITPAGVPVSAKDALIYYKSGYNGIRPDQVKPFPAGLRMVAGRASATPTNPQVIDSTQVFEISKWWCSSGGPSTKSITPNCAAGSVLVAEVRFPQCWDGRNLDSANHQSHMAYPISSGYKVGACPSTHPVAVPEIWMMARYVVPAEGTTGWRLSSDMYSGDQGGYSLHADWYNGWDPTTASTWYTRCVSANIDCGVDFLNNGSRLDGYGH